MSTPHRSTNRAAARATAERAIPVVPDPAGRKQLLDMLGLLDDNGHITADLTDDELRTLGAPITAVNSDLGEHLPLPRRGAHPDTPPPLRGALCPPGLRAAIQNTRPADPPAEPAARPPKSPPHRPQPAHPGSHAPTSPDRPDRRSPSPPAAPKPPTAATSNTTNPSTKPAARHATKQVAADVNAAAKRKSPPGSPPTAHPPDAAPPPATRNTPAKTLRSAGPASPRKPPKPSTTPTSTGPAVQPRQQHKRHEHLADGSGGLTCSRRSTST
jgi:hypothetical protein